MSLGKRVFIAFFVFILLPLFVLGSVSYLVFQHGMQEKFTDQTELTLKAIGRHIGSVFKEANYFSDFWVTTEEQVGTIEGAPGHDGGANGEGGEAPAEDDLFENLQEIERLSRRVLLTYPGIQSVTLYQPGGQTVSAEFIPDSPIPREELTSHPIYETVLRKNGAPVWIGPYEDRKLTGPNNSYTQIRVLLDIDTLRSKGILVLRFRLSELAKAFQFYSGDQRQDRRYLIVNREGVVLLDTFEELQGQRISAYIRPEEGLVPASRDFQSRRMTFLGEESLVSVQDLDLERLGVGDWSLVSVTSWHYLSGDMASVLRWVVGITAASLACALLFNLMFVRRTVLFIIAAVKAMRRVERGELAVRLPLAGNDETTSLAKGFNRLVERVSELLEDVKTEQGRKRRAEMMLLQAQIKPHFLFNALESINILAVQNDGRKVSKMVQRLAKILRISIQQKEEIALAQELEHVTSYLEIQKYRFEELFDYEIDVPQELLAYRVLKLTLQPLVENSIQHGFEGIGHLGKIRVYAREEGERLALFVEDNGIGIPAERLAQLSSAGASSLEEMYGDSPETGERRGLGLGNVADRLRIQYGPGCGLVICSAPGHGTIIKCLVPRVPVSVDTDADADQAS